MNRKKEAEQTATGGRTDGDGANDGWEVARNGCGLIAVTDTLLYLLLKNENYSNEDLIASIRGNGNIKYSAYYDLVHQNNGDVNVAPYIGFNGESIASFLDGYFLVGGSYDKDELHH